MKSPILVLMTTGIVLAASMVQTDWSGGPSGEVTTTDWGSDFGSCFGMEWQASGVLTLGTELTWWRVWDDGHAHYLRTANANNDEYSDLFRCPSSCVDAHICLRRPKSLVGVGCGLD